MPGLIDAHVPLSYGYPKLPGEGMGRGNLRPELNALKAARGAQKALRAGVTSICVPGGTYFIDVSVRDTIRHGVIEGPRIHCAARMIIAYGCIEDGEPSWVGTPVHGVGVLCNTAAEMVTEVRRQDKHGVNFVKMADSRSGATQMNPRHKMCSIRIGRSRRRRPVAWKIALAMAGATPVIATSPRPFAPALLKLVSGLSMNATSIEPISAFTGSTYSARSALRNPPKRGSTSLASRSAAPIPHTTPLRTWLAAVRGLITRPQSATLTTRGTRMRRVPASIRTSTKCAT
jgi:hypothetical protein